MKNQISLVIFVVLFNCTHLFSQVGRTDSIYRFLNQTLAVSIASWGSDTICSEVGLIKITGRPNEKADLQALFHSVYKKNKHDSLHYKAEGIIPCKVFKELIAEQEAINSTAVPYWDCYRVADDVLCFNDALTNYWITERFLYEIDDIVGPPLLIEEWNSYAPSTSGKIIGYIPRTPSEQRAYEKSRKPTRRNRKKWRAKFIETEALVIGSLYRVGIPVFDAEYNYALMVLDKVTHQFYTPVDPLIILYTRINGQWELKAYVSNNELKEY